MNSHDDDSTPHVTLHILYGLDRIGDPYVINVKEWISIGLYEDRGIRF